MKLSLGLLQFGSSKKPSKKKSRSMTRSETPSFGSGTTSSSSSSDDSTSTPKTVLPPISHRKTSKKASSGGCDYHWHSSSDYDAVGKITRRELELALRRLGPDPPTEEEIDSMLAEADREGDGCITIDELGGNDLRDAFGIFDADGDGKISAEELLGVFLALGDEGCCIDDCRRMIGGVDSDGDGFVCFEDFVRMMDGQR